MTDLDFKPSVASEKSLGGFDSHPLPLLLLRHLDFSGFRFECGEFVTGNPTSLVADLV